MPHGAGGHNSRHQNSEVAGGGWVEKVIGRRSENWNKGGQPVTRGRKVLVCGEEAQYGVECENQIVIHALSRGGDEVLEIGTERSSKKRQGKTWVDGPLTSRGMGEQKKIKAVQSRPMKGRIQREWLSITK